MLGAPRPSCALYLLLWLLMGVLLAALLALQGGLPWTGAFGAGLPLAVAYAFICLSAWYVARRCRSPAPARAGRGHGVRRGRAVVGDVAGARPRVAGGDRHAVAGAGGANVRRDPDRCSSASACCSICCRSPSATCWSCSRRRRTRERRGAAGAGAGARGRAAIAARADRSALPVQQPALDQRADHGRSAGGAADVPAARRLPARDAGARRRERITLARELALVERFLAIEQVRFGDRLATVDRCRGDAGDVSGAAAAAAAAGRERRDARHRAPARGRHGSGDRRARRRPAADRGRESVRSGSAAAAGHRRRAGERAAPGCARSTAPTRRSSPRSAARRLAGRAVAAGDRTGRRHDRRETAARGDRGRRAAGAGGGARVSRARTRASRWWRSAPTASRR